VARYSARPKVVVASSAVGMLPHDSNVAGVVVVGAAASTALAAASAEAACKCSGFRRVWMTWAALAVAKSFGYFCRPGS